MLHLVLLCNSMLHETDADAAAGIWNCDLRFNIQIVHFRVKSRHFKQVRLLDFDKSQLKCVCWNEQCGPFKNAHLFGGGYKNLNRIGKLEVRKNLYFKKYSDL